MSITGLATPGFLIFVVVVVAVVVLAGAFGSRPPLSVLVSSNITSTWPMAWPLARQLSGCLPTLSVFTPGLFVSCLAATWDLEALVHKDQAVL